MFGRPWSMQQLRMRNIRLVVSDSYDPYTNLSLEEELFASCKGQEGEEFFLLYINGPAVVIGKHQNPWKECNMQLLGERSIPLLRRISGGGTVYHDQGNINWSFIGPKNGFSQEENLELIKQSAARFSGLPETDFTVGERGDIFYRGLKISGNALTFKGSKALHHGTLLVSADTGSLGAALRGWETRFSVRLDGPGVNSNPSPVTNLSRHGREPMSCPDFYLAAGDILGDAGAYGGYHPLPELNKDVARRMDEHRSPEWTLRRTPDCRIFPQPGEEGRGNRPADTGEPGATHWLLHKGRVYNMDGRELYDLCASQELRNFEARMAALA